MKRAPVSLVKHTDPNTGRECRGDQSAQFPDGAVCKGCQFERVLHVPTATPGLMYAPVERARVLTGMHPARVAHLCMDHCVLDPYSYVLSICHPLPPSPCQDNLCSLTYCAITVEQMAVLKTKQNKKCIHGKQPRICKDCGGSGLCEHQRVRYICKDCGGDGICEHQRQSTR